MTTARVKDLGADWGLVSCIRRRAPTGINIDMERPLLLTDLATAVEIPDYYAPWMRPAATTTGR